MFQGLMLVPSYACPARCHYCFGPKGTGAVMNRDVLDSVAGWLGVLQGDRPPGEPPGRPAVVFHGGEPLTAGIDFFRRALPRLGQAREAAALKGHRRRALKSPEASPKRRPRLNIQSNLWLLTGELCELFAEYGVSLGTSLDGPEPVTDAQRGRGYFRRTMAGIRLARRHGLKIGCICTFTRRSAPRAGEVLQFFIEEGLDFTIHAAVPGISADDAAPGTGEDRWSISPEAYGELLVSLLDSYIPNLGRIRISTLDLLSRSISSGDGGICTFRDCLGSHLAIAPDGGIYPCQRFAGLSTYRIGRVQDRPDHGQLERSPVWRLFKERQEQVSLECGDCPYFHICRGGCPYNALAARTPVGTPHNLKDPYCPSYRMIFSHITERALAEVFSDENMQEVVERPGGSLLRRGPILDIMRGAFHLAKTLQ
jgi:uncharacterized protein